MNITGTFELLFLAKGSNSRVLLELEGLLKGLLLGLTQPDSDMRILGMEKAAHDSYRYD